MIRFDQVTKTYSGTSRPALNSVSLEVLKGEFVFLVGASGSGKSSFLRLVLKEEKPSKGKIHVLGQELTTLASRKVPYFRRSLGVVFQDFRLLPGKTVFDNVAFSLQVIGKSKGFIQEAVPDVLKMVGLAGKQGRFPHELSGGEQQRVAIARAVVNRPAILLADEPTGNLDPNTSAGIMSLLSTINANGTTVIMATHDVSIVDQMQRRVIELVSGQIVRDERGGSYQTQAIPVQGFAMAQGLAMAEMPRERELPQTVTTPVVTSIVARETLAEHEDAAMPAAVLAPAPTVEPEPEPQPAPTPEPAVSTSPAAAAPVPDPSEEPAAEAPVPAPDPWRDVIVDRTAASPYAPRPDADPFAPPPLNDPSRGSGRS